MGPKRVRRLAVVSRAQKAAEAQAERRSVRRSLGKPSDFVISAGALKRYEEALRVFFRWLQASRTPWPSSCDALDLSLCDYIDMAFCEGDPKSLIANLLSALHHFVPNFRGHLNGST